MSTIIIKLIYKGRSKIFTASNRTTVNDIHGYIRSQFEELKNGEAGDEKDVSLKLLHKGKKLSSDPNQILFPNGVSSNNPLKIIIMATPAKKITELNSARSDPTIRGFDKEKTHHTRPLSYWGTLDVPHPNYNFKKFESCSWQSFGTRAGSKTPHSFRALDLLKRIATDPGVVAVMTARELLVNTLGEMDPIDDQLKHKKEKDGGCLLGYNSNHGLRIDLLLRKKNLEQGFLPYKEIVATLIHELSHNWVNEHNALFWANYGQMRVEYLHRHAVCCNPCFVLFCASIFTYIFYHQILLCNFNLHVAMPRCCACLVIM